METQRVALGGPKQRALLALLLLRANEVVSRGRLIDALWGERAPASAERSLDSYVSRLRTVLGAERIERRAPGYRLRVDAEELDFGRFEVLLERGQAAAAAGHAGGPRNCCVRRSPFGAGVRSLISSSSRSWGWKQSGSRSAGCSHSRRWSTPSSQSAPAQS